MLSVSRLAVFVAICVAALSACTTVPTVTARHTPIYNEANHTSQIVASATAQRGLDYIQILVTHGTSVICPYSGDVPSPFPCRKDAVAESTACFFYNNETTGGCSFNQPIVAGSLVTYTVRAKDKNGTIVVQDPVTYSGGRRLLGIYCWFMWGFLPVLECADWGMLNPIWWQTRVPEGQGLRKDQVDIALHEDVDQPLTQQQYANMIDPIVSNIFFNTTSSWSDDITFARDSFTIWSGPGGADRDACGSGDFNFNRESKIATGYTDAEVIFHTDAGDPDGCSRIAFGGPSWEFINRNGAAQRFIHEKGHSLAALGDEYFDRRNPSRSYSSSSVPNNVYSSKDKCEDVAEEIGVSTALCVNIMGNVNGIATTTNYWRITDGTSELMADDQSATSDWRDASDRAFRRLLRNCAAGECY